MEAKSTKQQEAEKMHKLFRDIWDEREDELGYCYCFETGVPMHSSEYRNITTVYDHVLEKGVGAYPQYKWVRKNIIIVHPDVHMRKGINTPKIDKYRKELLSLHYSGNLTD